MDPWDFNYPAFHRAADQLRAAGYEVENPADNALIVPTPKEWADWMRLGLRQLLTCQAVALLPGWESSKGATLERSVGEQLGMRVAPVNAFLVAAEISEGDPR